MAWTNPTTRSLSDVIDPTIWNGDVVDNLTHLKRGVVGKDADFTTDDTEAMVYVVDTAGGVVTATLADPTTAALTFLVIQRNGGSAVNITGTVNGVSNPTIATDGHAMLLFSDGTEWRGLALTAVT